MKSDEAAARPSVRIDRWLDVACVFKTRSQARAACLKGRVSLNGTPCKPMRAIKPGDEIRIRNRGWTRILRVEKLADRNLPRSEARALYEDLTPERPRLDPVEALLRDTRPAGTGRPTKKERRVLSRLRRR